MKLKILSIIFCFCFSLYFIRYFDFARNAAKNVPKKPAFEAANFMFELTDKIQRRNFGLDYFSNETVVNLWRRSGGKKCSSSLFPRLSDLKISNRLWQRMRHSDGNRIFLHSAFYDDRDENVARIMILAGLK